MLKISAVVLKIQCICSGRFTVYQN